MRVRIETRLEAPIDRVWDALQTPALLRHVAAPLLFFRPVGQPFPERFADGRVRVSMWLFGAIPFGRQWIDVSRPEGQDGVRRIRDNGSGDLVRRWDHMIAVRALSPQTTHYEDTVEIDAGLLTPAVWLFAVVFYRWRQHRWRRLVRRSFRMP